MALLRYPDIPFTPTPKLFVTFSDVRKDFAAVANETSIERQARLLSGSGLNRRSNLANNDHDHVNHNEQQQEHQNENKEEVAVTTRTSKTQ